jgi:hypothetical protein
MPLPTLLLAPLHLLTYSTLLGTQLYQTFLLNNLSYRVLPRPAFTTLQRRLFPVYFRAQVLLLCLAALTLPPHGLRSVAGDMYTCVALGFAGMSAGMNWGVYGPRLDGVVARQIQMGMFLFGLGEKRKRRRGVVAVADVCVARRQTDEKYDVGEAEKVLRKAFHRAHAMCIHLNIVTICATVWYGWRLAMKFDFGGT